MKDTFSMSDDDYELIFRSQDRGMARGIMLSKSGVVRSALRVLASLDEEAFIAATSNEADILPGTRRRARK